MDAGLRIKLTERTPMLHMLEISQQFPGIGFNFLAGPVTDQLWKATWNRINPYFMSCITLGTSEEAKQEAFANVLITMQAALAIAAKNRTWVLFSHRTLAQWVELARGREAATEETEEECGALDTSDLLSMIDCIESLDEVIIEAEELLKSADLPYHANDGVEIGY